MSTNVIETFKSKYENIEPGSITQEIILDIAANVDFHSTASETFQWFAGNVKLFNFQSHDNITLQAYHIESNLSNTNNDILLYFTGYTETTIKYSHYLKDMHSLGYEIFSFDLRGQGFSGLTPGGYNDGSVTYISSITDSYVKDLELFLNDYVFPAQKSKTEAEKVINAINENNISRIIYSGNSLSAMIGLSYHLQNPTVFSKLILITPCIKPNISLLNQYVIKSIGNVGNYTGTDSNVLATRFGKGLDEELLTHEKNNLQLWITLRDMFPKYLIIAGPTFRFLHEMLITSDYLLKIAKNITTDILIFQADQDVFVDNASIDTFFTSVSSSYTKMIRYTSAYHELLVETNSIYNSLITEVTDFLNMKTTNNNHRDNNASDDNKNGAIQSKIILNSAASNHIDDVTKNTNNGANEL